jgi:hypothetical protein
MSKEDTNIFLAKSAFCASNIYAECRLFTSQNFHYTSILLADAGNLPLSSIYGNNEAYNIPCGSINWHSFVYAQADTLTDTDILLQPPPTTVC